MKVIRSLVIRAALLSLLLACSPLASTAQTNSVRARVTQAVDLQNLTTLRGNVHPLARQEFDQGVAPDDLPMERILLVLQRGSDQEASLRQLLDQQQVQSSGQFHQWLTPEQLGRQFGPADSDIQAVTQWLTSQGFQVTKVGAGRTAIEFSGTAGLVRTALGTEIHKFRVNGSDYWANATDPQIPAALAPVVRGFDSLNNFPRKPLHEHLGTFRKSRLTGEVKPLFTFSPPGQTGSYIALGPTDFATIYNIAPLWTAGTTGAGQTIAVVGETNINLQDVADFRSMFGLPANTPNIILNGPDPGITSTDETEADLDVEWSGAVAKGATVDLVVSETTESTPGIDLSALYIVDNNLAPIMSISYGGCEAQGDGSNAFHAALWEQAAAQGITVVIASGDSGSAGCDYSGAGEVAAQYGLAVSGLASTPFNVAVGGTDFNDLSNAPTYWNQANASPGQNSAKSYIPEMPWNDSCASSGVLAACASPDSTYLNAGADLAAGGGGASGLYAKPSWQTGTGVPADGARDLPDVSLFSGDGFNASFYVICEIDANAANGGSSTSCDLTSPFEDFQGVGGTSAAAQVFAGVMAMVTQAHGRQGNANYVLYPLAAQGGNTCVSNAAAVSNASCIFYDIDNATGSTTVNSGNSVLCYGGSPNCSNISSGEGAYGIMAYDNLSLAAYSNTAGYDLATGLGTVNVANLVNHWASNFTPSTLTLQLSTTPASTPLTQVHGQPVNFVINAGSGNGTPSGDVSLIAQTGNSSTNVTGIGPFTLSSGSATGSTIFLPGGTYNVTAHYAGNGTFAASDSTPGIPIIVTKESSQTQIHLVTFDDSGNVIPNNGSVVYGTPYYLRMDVTNGTGNLCANLTTEVIAYACPTGSLTVSPAPAEQNPPPGTVPGQYKLNTQGYAEDQPIQLSPQTYNFSATYAGDNSYTGSGPSMLTVSVSTAPTSTSISGLPSSGLAGAQFTVTATVSTDSNGAAPTGTIQLLNNGSPLGSAVTVTGTASTATAAATAQAVVTATLPTGSPSISAQYSGDVNYAGSTSSATTVAISDFSVAANPSPINISAPGQGGSSTIGVTGQNGFSGTVNLSVASGCPTGATCTISPGSLNVSGASPANSTLTITTTAASAHLPPVQRMTPPSFRLPFGLIGLLAGSLLLIFLLGTSAKRWRPAAMILASTVMVAGLWIACGGGSGGGGGGGTPPPAPAVSLSSYSLTFASQNTGTSSATQTVTLSNTGNAALSVSSISVSGTNAADFGATNTCGGSVAAGSNCSIGVTFTPTATGTRTAAVTIVDSASTSPQSISLTGTGAQPSTPTPVGNYPVVINAVSGGVTHSITVNVDVQ